MIRAVGCDTVGDYAIKEKRLLKSADLLKGTVQAKRGDVFLLLYKQGQYGWAHTGIVTNVQGTKLTTIEGNTNNNGSREGYELLQRERDISSGTIDIYSI